MPGALILLLTLLKSETGGEYESSGGRIYLRGTVGLFQVISDILEAICHCPYILTQICTVLLYWDDAVEFDRFRPQFMSCCGFQSL